jgi:hypothetical protein
MLGFIANAEPDEPVAEEELEAARWFSADEVRAGLANDWASADAEGEGIVLSSPISIARHVIRAWLAEHDARRVVTTSRSRIGRCPPPCLPSSSRWPSATWRRASPMACASSAGIAAGCNGSTRNSPKAASGAAAGASRWHWWCRCWSRACCRSRWTSRCGASSACCSTSSCCSGAGARAISISMSPPCSMRRMPHRAAPPRHACIRRASSPPLDGASLVEAVFRNAQRRWFGVLFWFCVLGPFGAVLYRLSVLAAEQDADIMPSDTLQGARVWLSLLEWPVTQLIALALALVGNFDSVLAAWREDDAFGLDSRLLPNAARASVRSEIAEEVADYTESGIPASTALAEVFGELPELRDAMNLAWRVLVLWLAVIALFVVAGWVS